MKDVDQPSSISGDSSDLSASRLLAERYRIEEQIGQGGMGLVFRGRHRKLDLPVAIKKLLPGIDGERFLREAELLASVQSPYVVKVYDFEVLPDRSALLVMELLNGESLEKVMKRCGPVPEQQLLPWMSQTAAALATASALGIVHRDVKPANIQIDECGRVKLMDFGLARSQHSAEITNTGTYLGTPYYMSPEQAEDARTVDARADIYSFGATFYHALTGRPPFQATSAFGVLFKHKTETVVPPQKFNPHISNRVARVLEKCLEKSPTSRFKSFEEILDRLGWPTADFSLKTNTAQGAYTSNVISPPKPNVVETHAATPKELITTHPRPYDPLSDTMEIPDSVIRPRTSRLSWVLATITAALVLIAGGAAATLYFLNRPGQPDLVPAGNAFILPFDQKTMAFDNWSRGYSSRWYVASNDDREDVLQGDGLIVRRFADVTGKAEGLPHYSLELFTELHQAKVVEVHVDFAGKAPSGDAPPRDDHRVVLRLSKEGSQLGTKSGDRQGWVARGPLVKFNKADGKHEVRLERHTAGWWVMVDDKVVGFYYSRVAHDANEFRLIAEDGEARFSDFHVQELRAKRPPAVK